MAYDSQYHIGHLKCLDGTDMLVSVAETPNSPSMLKLWDLHKLVNTQIPPDADPDDILKQKYHTQVIIHNGDNAYPISCFVFNDNFSCISIGYANGKVLLIRGDLLRDRGSKQRLIYESPDPVTGLQFNEFHDIIYVTTTSKILTLLTTGTNQGKPLKVLAKSMGIALNCTTKDKTTQELIVGVNSSIRYYNQQTKSHVINFDINKKLIYNFCKDYLLIISSEETNSTRFTTKVLILDLNYKHISFSLTLPNTTITHAFMWDELCLLSTDGVLYKINEKPPNQQVELMLQRDLFLLAYQVAKQSQLPVLTLLKICKQEGDFLYQQKEYSQSIESYVRCLTYYTDPKLELTPEYESLDDFIIYIITKLKDPSSIKYLTEFLYHLYESKMANNDHVTLLLCCYCKLKSVDNIRVFVDGLKFTDEDELTNLDFPLIINLFKECGYFKEVIQLLYKLNQPNLIVDIQLNDLNSPKSCLKYIKTLSIDDLLLILIEHSKTLLDNLPIETTELLINVFTGTYKREDHYIGDVNDNGNDSKDDALASFPINSYKNFLAYISGTLSEQETEPASDEQSNDPTYLPPRPSLIFLSFINNSNEFVVFLEACIETFDKYQGNINDKKDLLITLYEVYLSLAKKDADNEKEWSNKAQTLIQDYPDFLEESSLLLISHIYDFKPGQSIASAKGFEESLFRSCQLSGDVDGCFEIVNKFGSLKPELYKLLLRFIISSENIYNKVSSKDFRIVLTKIKDLKLATPLEIIQILGTTEFTTIGVIRDFLIDTIDVNNQEIHNNEKLIEVYEKESIKHNQELSELMSTPFIIQNNKCSACNLNLDFPVVHFKCKHSFHQRCLSNNYLSNGEYLTSDAICSICINDIDESQRLRDAQLRVKDELALFDVTLAEGSDKFKVISNYIGKGVMENDYIHLS